MATKASGHLEVHIFGAGQGESVVLRLPGNQWGVIDCFAQEIDDCGTNPSLQFLKNQGVETLDFLCMTHPHRDHVRGMSQFLREFEIRSFWRPVSMSQQRLEWILKTIHGENWLPEEPKATEDVEELFLVFSMLKGKNPDLLKGRPPKTELGTTKTLLSSQEHSPVKIWALAPSASQADRYENSLARNFGEDRKYRRPGKNDRPDHNISSMALLVEFGETRLVLGGDVLKSGWDDVMTNFDAAPLSAQLVKVSHHGSAGAYCPGLWEAFSDGTKPISVITPYRNSGLPREKGLEHIQKFSDRIVVPCIDAIHPESVPAGRGGINVQSSLLLRQQLKATQAGPFRTGRCGFVFDDKGTCIEESTSGPAGEI